jgi:hypothetical protein
MDLKKDLNSLGVLLNTSHCSPSKKGSRAVTLNAQTLRFSLKILNP